MAGRSVEPKAELNRLESVIEKGNALDIEACYALRDIRDKRLYKQRYNRWALYCQCHLDLNAMTAAKRIRAAYVMDALATESFPRVPATVAVASALAFGLRCGGGARQFIKTYGDEIRSTWREAVKEAGSAAPGQARVALLAERRRFPESKPYTVSEGPCLPPYSTSEVPPKSVVLTKYMLPARLALAICRILSLEKVDELISELLTISRGSRKPAERKTNDNYASAV